MNWEYSRKDSMPIFFDEQIPCDPTIPVRCMRHKGNLCARMRAVFTLLQVTTFADSPVGARNKKNGQDRTSFRTNPTWLFFFAFPSIKTRKIIGEDLASRRRVLGIKRTVSVAVERSFPAVTSRKDGVGSTGFPAFLVCMSAHLTRMLCSPQSTGDPGIRHDSNFYQLVAVFWIGDVDLH